jgi:hypothetical protein
MQHDVHRELCDWLDRHGYHHTKQRGASYLDLYCTKRKNNPGNPGRIILQAPTGRPVFAAHERNHHITTSGRRVLRREQFALPPGPKERRRGIKGRLPIDTIGRAHSALARASMMRNQGTISARELAEARRAVHRAWPSIS